MRISPLILSIHARARHQRRLKYLLPSDFDTDQSEDKEDELRVCQMLRGAQQTLGEMPWFGHSRSWVGSVCLYHHLRKIPFPNQDARVCPGPRNETADGNAKSYSTITSPAKWCGDGLETGCSSGRRLEGRGTEPQVTNGYSVCPIELAEAVVEASGARRAIGTAHRFPELLAALQPHLDGSPGTRTMAESALEVYADEIFIRRVAMAAKELHDAGASIENVPAHLTAACFARPPPMGFAWQ